VVERLGKAVKYKASIGADAWTCEWPIPFAACGFTPKTAPKLLFNLGVRKLADNAWVIWRGALGQRMMSRRRGNWSSSRKPDSGKR